MLKVLVYNDTRILASNPYWDYALDDYLLPDGSHAPYYYVRSRGSSVAIPRTPDGLFIMVRQYRHLGRRFSIEFPGGGCKSEHTPEETIREELCEEAGITEADVRLIGTINPCVGITDEICSIYYADVHSRARPRPERSEEFEVIAVSEKDIHNYIITGELWNGMTLAAWALFRSWELSHERG